MERITQAMLNRQVGLLNQETGNPAEYYTDGKANVGNYHLDGAYGSVSLVQTCNESGGVRTIFGFGAKRELYNQIQAFRMGLASGKA